MNELPDRVRRRLEEVFGDVLPSTTRDEQDDDPRPPGTGDEELLADRPPHHVERD
ncbi:hypothetical protein [Pseudonocardia sp. GCM10023141]|uniref:hypothetical protein n=1 Tax=Pseudonocardia sp. GCM10023141 TaxID=3252653 RepID=UPI003613E5CE